MSTPRQLILGVTGSIAAYKAAPLVRLLTTPAPGETETPFEVWPVLTENATHFLGPMTLSALCGRPAAFDMWSSAAGGEISHVELAHRADLVLVAPCTADTMARLAHGRADNLLSAIALATTAPTMIAPAMESGMWLNAATQHNLDVLRHRGVAVVPPAKGGLASGREGVGRMAEPETIFEAVLSAVTPKDLVGRRLLVTAGPTREPFDPVRFLTNHSSGKMGYAIARVAQRRGADVCLVSGPVNLEAPHNVETVAVQSTQGMLEACQKQLTRRCDALIMAAAPVDYRPARVSETKIKKGNGPGLEGGFEPTPDILASLQAHNRGCMVVGFAAETNDVVANARAKLEAKHLDLIVANDLTRPDAGFGVDTNAVTFIGVDGTDAPHETLSKEQVAWLLLDRVAASLERRGPSD